MNYNVLESFFGANATFNRKRVITNVNNAQQFKNILRIFMERRAQTGKQTDKLKP